MKGTRSRSPTVCVSGLSNSHRPLTVFFFPSLFPPLPLPPPPPPPTTHYHHTHTFFFFFFALRDSGFSRIQPDSFWILPDSTTCCVVCARMKNHFRQREVNTPDPTLRNWRGGVGIKTVLSSVYVIQLKMIWGGRERETEREPTFSFFVFFVFVF